jgi:hypothetical protein
MRLAKFDELDSLIRGMLYVETNNPCECYYWVNPTEDERCEKRFFDFSDPYPFLVSHQLSWQSSWRYTVSCIKPRFHSEQQYIVLLMLDTAQYLFSISVMKIKIWI